MNKRNGMKFLSDTEEKNMLAEYISGQPVKALCKKYGYASKKSIIDKLKKHYPANYLELMNTAQKNRKGYSYRIPFIRNEFDAYFVGLLMTDGYITKNKEQYRVGLDLTDEDCIKFISETIGVNYKKYDGEEKDLKPRFRIVIYEKELIEDLKRFGVVQNKSLTLSPPLLKPEEEKYIPYILRGIIDGNGCVTPTSYGAPFFCIYTMSTEFAEWLVYILENKMYMKDIRKRLAENRIWRIETANRENIIKLLALTYNKPFGMSRKYKELSSTFRDYNSAPTDEENGIVQTTTATVG